jgi:hypothetical protein
MKRTTIIFITLLSLCAFINHNGGIYKTNTGNISFYSHTPVEDISAENHKVKTAFSSESGQLQFSCLIKDFEFKKALMQDHFNENYMESTTYPKATFNGEIESISSIDFDKDGTYSSKVNGKLTIKDITKDVATTGSFTVKDGMVNANATFNLNPYDYNVKIPKMVAPKISESIKITINSDYIHRH